MSDLNIGFEGPAPLGASVDAQVGTIHLLSWI